MRSSILFLVILLTLSGLTLTVGTAGPAASLQTAPSTPGLSASENTFDLTTFGAVGDGIVDDGPALQSALNAIAAAGGGTLLVPAGRYAIITPVLKNFSGTATSLAILGVASLTPVNTQGSGQELTRGLDLTSEFVIKTGVGTTALTLVGLDSLLISEMVFIGTQEALTDAQITLAIYAVANAAIRHCEFYGLSTLWAGGAVVRADNSRLTIDRTVFLGCTGNSGVRNSVVLSTTWKGLSVTETIFADYGQRPNYYGKLGLAPPFSWIMVGDASPASNLSPRREVTIRNVFLDEGGFFGISAIPDYYDPQSAASDLIYISDLRMNVSSLNAAGIYLTRAKRVLIERAKFGLSLHADAAVNILNVGEATLDRLECLAASNRIRANSGTGRLTVINSIYTQLDSQAQTTEVITTDTEDEDLVQYVRQQYLAVPGHEPDAAGHDYWSDIMLGCGANEICLAAKRLDLSGYLASEPLPFFSVTGRILNEDGAAMPGVVLNLTGSQVVTTQTDTAGNYRFEGLPTSGVYTVTPVRVNHTFDASTWTTTTPSGDCVADFTAIVNNYSIAGRVLDSTGPALSGATVTLSGSQVATTTTDASGNYGFTVPAEGNYTVSAAKVHYVFAPPTTSFSNLSGNQTANFSGTLNKHTITGQVTNANGNPVAGVTVSLSGAQVATAISSSTGAYSFSSLDAGRSYTVTPAKQNYSFSPTSRVFNDLGANQVANFTGTLVNYSITGRVLDSAGQSLSGATVTLSGSRAATTTTNASGNYSFIATAEGSYTVSAAKVHYVFAPPSTSFSNLNGNQTANFSGTLNKHTITGQVTNASGNAVAGVTVSLSGAQVATAITSSTGTYSFSSLDAGRNYTITPAKQNYGFSPLSRVFNDLGANQVANFTGTLVNYSIAGRVLDSTGATLSGAAVTLSGSRAATTTTDEGGNYDFTVPAEGNYTVSVAKVHYVFAPPSTSFSNLGGNQTANFSGTLQHAVTGRIISSDGSALAGITVSLSGSGSDLAMTGSDGRFSFSVPTGGTYTVTPTRTNYLFTPASALFTNLDGARDTTFSATLQKTLEFSAASYRIVEGETSLVVTVVRNGDISGPASATYSTNDDSGLDNCSTPDTDLASSGCDYITSIGTVRFAPGETSKTFSVPIIDDGYAEGSENFEISLSNLAGVNMGPHGTASVTIADNETVDGTNPIERAGSFVRQHYIDFFNREPDAAGLAFWTNQITSCGSDAGCVDLKRANASAAFFLSIEFRETGYLVYRMHKAAYGNLPGTPVPVRFDEFLTDTQQIGQDVVVGQTGWEQQLEINKSSFAADFVARSRFTTAHPTTLTPTQFVEALFANAGVTPSAAERTEAINEFGTAGTSADMAARERALRRVAENQTFAQQEFNKAFVLMQYFGYVRRNPNDAPEPGLNFDGYNFWLGKLNQFGGNFVNADMVKAFIISGEYRQRFGP